MALSPSPHRPTAAVRTGSASRRERQALLRVTYTTGQRALATSPGTILRSAGGRRGDVRRLTEEMLRRVHPKFAKNRSDSPHHLNMT